MAVYIQILTTAARKSEALRIANALVDERLAACAQVVGPISSVYVWKRRKHISREWLCIIKSDMKRYRRVERRIKELSAYEVPEITYSRISGSSDYLSWIGDTVNETDRKAEPI